MLLGRTTIQILPPPGDPDFEANGNSVGIIVSYGEFSAALTGDATPEEFAYWQETYSELLRPVDVYKSSHHGSDDGDDAASVRAWQPEAVVISVGESNPYGHPTPEALALYESVGATVYRTDQSGTVVVTAEPDGSYTVNLSPSEPRLAAPPLSEPTSSSTTTPDLPYDPQGPDRDCTDFEMQEEAQAFYEAAGGPAQDSHGLDGDGNGVACESLL